MQCDKKATWRSHFSSAHLLFFAAKVVSLGVSCHQFSCFEVFKVLEVEDIGKPSCMEVLESSTSWRKKNSVDSAKLFKGLWWSYCARYWQRASCNLVFQLIIVRHHRWEVQTAKKSHCMRHLGLFHVSFWSYLNPSLPPKYILFYYIIQEQTSWAGFESLHTSASYCPIRLTTRSGYFHCQAQRKLDILFA